MLFISLFIHLILNMHYVWPSSYTSEYILLLLLICFTCAIIDILENALSLLLLLLFYIGLKKVQNCQPPAPTRSTDKRHHGANVSCSLDSIMSQGQFKQCHKRAVKKDTLAIKVCSFQLKG